MGANCLKGSSSNRNIDMTDEQTRKEYYLNMRSLDETDSNNIGAENYDIKEKKCVGYGHKQKTNMFHQMPQGKSAESFHAKLQNRPTRSRIASPWPMRPRSTPTN